MQADVRYAIFVERLPPSKSSKGAGSFLIEVPPCVGQSRVRGQKLQVTPTIPCRAEVCVVRAVREAGPHLTDGETRGRVYSPTGSRRPERSPECSHVQCHARRPLNMELTQKDL